MAEELPESLRRLIHDVHSKCGSLRGAAELLRTLPPEESRKILKLMADEARAMAGFIEEYEKTL